MLELQDFIHLPVLDTLFDQLASNRPGLILVAGMEARPINAPQPGGGFRLSGRLTLFRILVRQILEAHPKAQAVIIAEDRGLFRVPRQFRRRVKLSLVQAPATYGDYVADAMRRNPGLLVLERLDPGSTAGISEAARRGIRVLAQFDTVFRGAGVVQHLREIGVHQELLNALTWILTVGRLPTLCRYCKRPAPPPPEQLEALLNRYPMLARPGDESPFFEPVGCARCQNTGRAGEVSAFDVYRANTDPAAPFPESSLLPLEAYLFGLAMQGLVPLADLYRVDADLLHHTYHRLTSSEHALADADAELRRNLAQLEASNQVSQGRTEALISLQDMGQALIASTELEELGARVCRHARDLCDADRAVLYLRRPARGVAVLAVSGWELDQVEGPLEVDDVFGVDAGNEPSLFGRWPPGIPPRHPDVEGVALRAGLRVPLIAQDQQVGLMIVHTTLKSSFTPGEVALLQTFANQAAVAIQRAGLIEQLREKLAELEAAQAELVEKERLEREMELARQVQQSVLPHIFPMVPGYTFGASNQPASQVGGDFYDVILLDGNRFGVVVADVSDKGMPAALYMALTRSLLLAEGRRDGSPRAVLTSVHRLLRDLGQPDMFVTVFYGVVDGPSRRLTYARAGHDRPLLLRDGRARPLGGEGIFLGFPDIDDLNLTEEQVDLLPGDRLVLYTDGLTDILSPAGQPYGLERLTSTLLTHARRAPQDLCVATFADLAAYQAGAEQYDDMTLLVVGLTG
jgi:sigma-B regulation protein RsbU (phosphoserine phosphatase)